jgi:hypothetical protein
MRMLRRKEKKAFLPGTGSNMEETNWQGQRGVFPGVQFVCP